MRNPSRVATVLAVLTAGLALAALVPLTFARGGATNKTCPISGEAVEADSPTVTYDGTTIALCCKSCVRKWNGYSAEQRSDLVAKATAPQDEAGKHEHGDAKKEAAAAPDLSGLYVLDTCPVSGEKLGGMGDPVVETIDGREVRFCCSSCVPKFKKESAEYFAKIDKKIADAQRESYPVETCVVGGGKLGSMGEPIELVHGNRLVRFCCASCKPKFEKDPAKYLAKLDEATIKKQRESYALKTCVVSGHDLEDGKAVDVVVAGKLIRLCCADCADKLKKDPAGYLAKLR